MFAFAIWDEVRGRLLLARDRFGEKPLFVHRHDRGLSFASEISALLDAYPRAPDLDLESMDMYMVLGYVPGPRTIIKGIEQLPPGQLLTWDAREDVVATKRYWAARRSALAGPESVAELTAETTRLLKRSVAATLVSDVPVGVFLSGGVDSTLVTAMVAEATPRVPQTFTVGYDVGEVSELAEARLVAERLGTEHHELVIDQADVARRVPAVLAELDQPLADPAVIPVHAVSELARRHVTVVIGGEGADELFGGYPRYRWLIRSTQLKRVLPERYAAVGARALSFPPFGTHAARLADVIAPQTTLERHLDWVTAHRRHARGGIYGPAMSDRAFSDVSLISLATHLDGFHGELGVDAFMQLDQRHWLPDDVLYKVDRAGMLNSVEIRAPYLARELAEFANSVRAATHLAGYGKKLLRNALNAYFPNERARRRKTAFRVPGAQWLRGPLYPILEDQLAWGTAVREGFIDGDSLRRTMSEHAGGKDRTSILWPVMALGLWLDRFVGRT
jgi:asparagine synthase (glutamine-hydrolysing)